MKLHLASAPGAHWVTGYGQGYVLIDAQRYEASLILLPDCVIADWAVASVSALTAEHLAALLPLKPELVLLGTGSRLCFPSPAVLAGLIQCDIGVEVMDTQAACRTYNILAAEGRRVAAALIIDT
ncbi:MAG: Mth938-like domain-containing protein [Thiobacillaceae bacterium]|nr:Mth938-like domain-containing protein [Thiobacillaceae bacterium]